MAKIFRCENCGNYLGEMSKGRIKGGAVLFCGTCASSVKLMKASKSARDPLDHLKDMFGEDKKKSFFD